jgi:HSP20 family protein
MRLARLQTPSALTWPRFGRLTDLRDEIDRLFDLSLGDWDSASPWMSGWVPALDVYENKDGFVVKAEMPGMKKEEIEVSLNAGTLSICGERKQESESKGQEWIRSERTFGRFQRTLELPATVQADKVNADYRDGILTVTLPKAEEAKPKQIGVTVG